MPTNKYFDNYDDVGQQRLYKELINEVVQIFGIDSSYIPRDSESSIDLFFGDDPTKKFTNSYPIEVYIQSTENFEGGDLFTKFGYTVSKQVRLLMGSDSFNKQTGGVIGVRPREGDLVWLKNFKILFEIKYVNQDKFFYTFGNSNFYGYELVCEEFRYNNEKIESGVPEIDDKINDVVIAYEATMGSGTLTYMVDEVVYQGANLSSAHATADVSAWNIMDKKLILKNIVGIFVVNTAIVGVTSGASFNLNSIEIQDNVNNQLDNNLEIRLEANSVLDTSESNAFGNPRT
jgi:hypothetical protein